MTIAEISRAPAVRPAEALTWAELVRLEPRLAALLAEARAVRDDGRDCFCADEHWGGQYGLKAKLLELVGWHARNPALASSRAYDVAYHTVPNALPPCRGECGCL
jgi:hypothetical protein